MAYNDPDISGASLSQRRGRPGPKEELTDGVALAVAGANGGVAGSAAAGVRRDVDYSPDMLSPDEKESRFFGQNS